MKKLSLLALAITFAFAASAQTKSKVYNCSAYGARDGAIDLIVTGGHPPLSYKWSNGSTEEDLHNLASGRYTVTVTDVTQHCSIEVSFDVAQPTNGVQSNNQPSVPRSDAYTSRFDVYPNPTETSSQIVYYNSDKEGFRVRVLNADGAEVFSENVTNRDGEYNHKLDFSGMPKGIYLVEIRSPKEAITKQLVVQ